jgi:hypothetical protein
MLMEAVSTSEKWPKSGTACQAARRSIPEDSPLCTRHHEILNITQYPSHFLVSKPAASYIQPAHLVMEGFPVHEEL